MSLRDKILSVTNDTPSELVSISEWGVDVLVKGFTLGAKDDFLTSVYDSETKKSDIKAFTVGVLVGTAYDPETEERLFTEADVPVLKQKSAAAIQRIVDVGTRLSGLTDDAVEVAGKKSFSTTKDEQDS
jgi:glycerol-3-phosphate dehydrogenase